MPFTDLTVNPPKTILLPHEVKALPLLKDAPVGTMDSFDGSVMSGPEYNSKDLYDHTVRMMDLMKITFEKPSNVPKLEYLDVETRSKLKPFAHFLAIIDGNDFTGNVDQYIPYVYAFFTRNGYGRDDKELKKTLKNVMNLYY